MTNALFRLTGVLLLATSLLGQLPPYSDPSVADGQFHWFQLSETRTDVAKRLGLPTMAASFGADFESWQYQIGPVEEEGFSHQFVFRKSTGTLIGVTRNYETERDVDGLFPAAESTTHFYPGAGRTDFGVRVRRLGGGRLLIATGVTEPGRKTGQIVLILESELRYFYPWLADQLTIGK